MTIEEFKGYVIGVGASAGGLEALERFFAHCPADTGAAFVVVQHLSPDHKSIMANLLARHTRMPVSVVEDGMSLAPNSVYLIPPGQILKVAGSRLQLEPKQSHGLVLPIDVFLVSLAAQFGERSVGVILSGTGSDGTRGAVEINAAGGLMLAQDPAEAKFDGMPASVIATGLVDAILPAEALPERLVRHLSNPEEAQQIKAAGAGSGAAADDEQAFAGIMELLRQHGGIDFTDYKDSTVGRRIERRMQVRHARTMAAYLDLLHEERGELATLRRELLIPVTSFFRDESAFRLLEERAVTTIVKNAARGDQVRVWVAGCSTGEEAYSIAMLFLEQFEKLGRHLELKIFATDVNEASVEFAAAGQYPESAAAELTPQRLERFFNKVGHSYAVTSELRQCIVFARHNLLADPPFTRMNLVTCRNTLIYFRRDAQLRALRRLQYALRSEGFLFLGPSESLAGQEDAFETVHSKSKIYRRTSASVPAAFSIDYTMPRVNDGVRSKRPKADAGRPSLESQLIDQGLHRLLDAYAPPSIIINDKHEAVHLFGDIQPFVRFRQGMASLDIERLLVDRMVPVASALLYKSAKDGRDMTSSPLQLACSDGQARLVQLRVRPLTEQQEERFLLLSIESLEQSDEGPLHTIDVDIETQARLDVLEQELSATRESLQSTIEELETSNEELQATNEELMASNEELQSSNEELQSVNEELNTVNAEYQEKMLILNRLHADIDSMEKAVGIATVFVDDQLRVTRFSPDAVGLFKLREGDVGRPLDEIVHRIKHPGLMADIEQTLRTDRSIERELPTVDDRVVLMRTLPYRIGRSQHRGAVASFVDVTVVKSLERLQAVIDALPEHIAVLEVDGTIALVNRAWRQFAAANGDASLAHTGVGCNYLEACRAADDQGDEPARLALRGVKAVLEGTRDSFSLRYPCHSPDEQRWFILNAAAVRHGGYGAVVSHLNITEWYRPQEDEALVSS